MSTQKIPNQPFGRILSRTGKSFLLLLNKHLKKLDLQRNYYALLIIESRSGKITQNDLAKELETDKVSIVRIVDYLSNKGYIQRVKGSSDKRKYYLEVTDKTREAIPVIDQAIQSVTDKAFKGISPPEQEAFLSTLKRIKMNLSSETPKNI